MRKLKLRKFTFLRNRSNSSRELEIGKMNQFLIEKSYCRHTVENQFPMEKFYFYFIIEKDQEEVSLHTGVGNFFFFIEYV